MLLVASGLVALAALQLFVLTDHTDSYFSWTIAPGLTAAFLGAGYFASFFLENLAARRAAWADARVSVPPVLVFTVLTEIATLVHVGKFHFHERLIWAGLAAWIWIAIYTLVPIAMVLLLPAQLRSHGDDPPRTASMPTIVAIVLGLQALAVGVIGLLLFLDPVRWASIWPWTLTPLTGQAVGAWLLGIAVGVAGSIVERDLVRIRPAMTAYALFGTAELVALARYGADVRWGEPQSWIFLGIVASIGAVGWLGVSASTKATTAA